MTTLMGSRERVVALLARMSAAWYNRGLRGEVAQSGRVRTIGNRVGDEPRGFKSRPLRQFSASRGCVSPAKACPLICLVYAPRPFGSVLGYWGAVVASLLGEAYGLGLSPGCDARSRPGPSYALRTGGIA